MNQRECVTLPNGLQIWLDPQPDRYTAAFGVWVSSGSCMETPEQNGISHFLEHMFFKGSQTRTAAQLAAEMDGLGGQLNAFTAKEYTCFYARTLAEHVADGFALLADMLRYPAMQPELLETERGVVLEEISAAADDPEDAVGERLEQAIWAQSPYGRPILGTRETVEVLTVESLNAHRARMFVPNRMVVSISGAFDRDAFLAQVTDAFGDLTPGVGRAKPDPIPYTRADIAEKRRLEQTHICLALPAVPAQDPRRWALTMLSSVLGGASSSRLFQRIREELGLAYAIDSDVSLYDGGGALYIQAAVSPNQMARAAAEIGAVLRALRAGVTAAEFDRAREGLRASLRMSMESSMSRAAYAGRTALTGSVRTDDEILAQVARVTRDDVNALAAELLDLDRLSVSVCGNAPRDWRKSFANR